MSFPFHPATNVAIFLVIKYKSIQEYIPAYRPIVTVLRSTRPLKVTTIMLFNLFTTKKCFEKEIVIEHKTGHKYGQTRLVRVFKRQIHKKVHQESLPVNNGVSGTF
jgi:hypothetical protein